MCATITLAVLSLTDMFSAHPAMRRNRAIAAKTSVLASLVARLKPILQLWTTCIWMVSTMFSLVSLQLIPCLALGITDEVEMLGLKGNKKKKGKKLDEDFIVSSVTCPIRAKF